MEIPRGNCRDDNKARKQIIKDFYASWIADRRISEFTAFRRQSLEKRFHHRLDLGIARRLGHKAQTKHGQVPAWIAAIRGRHRSNGVLKSIGRPPGQLLEQAVEKKRRAAFRVEFLCRVVVAE